MIKHSAVFLLITACFLFIFAPFAYADVIVEPNNDFYTQHSSECTYLNRSFYANGEGGSISLKKEPGSKEETASVKNGKVINIIFTYNYEGEIWGVTLIYEDNTPFSVLPNGWVPMSQLLIVYDYLSFAQDHQAEIYSFTGSYDSLKTADKIIMWSWPGSGVEAGSIDQGENSDLSVTDAYKDDQGREWGFIGYWHGNRNFWICISDPANSDIPAFNPPPKPVLWQPGDTSTNTPEAVNTNTNKSGPSMPTIIIVLVSAVVICTAVLIRVFWKPRKGNNPK